MPDDFLNDLPLGDTGEDLEETLEPAEDTEEIVASAEDAEETVASTEEETVEAGPAPETAPAEPGEPETPAVPADVNEETAKRNQAAAEALQPALYMSYARILGENDPRHQKEMERRRLRSTR